MFATDQAPGVYYQTVDAGSPAVTPLRTDITAFVGIAERGPVDLPVPVESWQQFVSWFGGCIGAGFLAYAVRGFLENGGRRCWVVRVTSDDPLRGSAAAEVILSSAAGPVWSLRASSPGVWGDQLSVSVRERNQRQVHTGVHDPDGRWSVLPSLSGFSRGTMVRVSQTGVATPVLKVVAGTDGATSRLYWVDPDPARRLPRDDPLRGFQPDRPVLLETVEYQVVVSERGRLLRIYEGLSLVPENARYAPTVLPAPRAPVDPVTGAVLSTSPEPVVVEPVPASPGSPPGLAALVVDPALDLPLTGGRDGLAALTVHDFVGDPFGPGDSPEAIALKRRGLRAVQETREIGLLAVPDINIRPVERNQTAPAPACVPDPCLDQPVPVVTVPVASSAEQPPVFAAADIYRMQAEMVLQCETKQDRFALLDAPFSVSTDPAAGTRGVLDWRARFDTSYAALSHPWLQVADPLEGQGSVRLVPSSGHVAGLVAATDLESGVHRAPANRPLAWALGPSVTVSDGQHALLNQHGVNVLRTVGSRGLRLLGARTMSSDPDWRFVNVRRLMAMIEKALGIALEWAVFEPNGFLTRARATMSVTFFLDGLHEAGMLAGATAEGSFFVRCDLDNNPAATRDVGELIVEVGVAPAQPFEFVLLRVGRVTDSIEVRESTGSLGATGTGA